SSGPLGAQPRRLWLAEARASAREAPANTDSMTDGGGSGLQAEASRWAPLWDATGLADPHRPARKRSAKAGHRLEPRRVTDRGRCSVPAPLAQSLYASAQRSQAPVGQRDKSDV